MPERKMTSKFIENEILGTSRKCSKDEEKCEMSARQNSGCEISGEGWTSAKQNSGCEISGEGGTLTGQNSGCEISRWNDGREEFRVECRRGRILDVRCPGGMSAGKNSGCEMSGWNERCHVHNSLTLSQDFKSIMCWKFPSQETIVKPSSPTILFLHIASEPAPEAVTGENDKTEYK